MKKEIKDFRDRPDDDSEAYEPWVADKGVKSKKKSKKNMKQRTLIINSSAINTMCGESEQVEGGQQKLEIRENIGEPIFVIEKIPSNTASSNTGSGSGSGGSNENSKGSNPSK